MEKIKKSLASPKITVRQALKQMDEAGEKILFVVDDTKRLLGVVTDGNIRRWILRGGSLVQPISKAMHKRPIILHEGYTKEQAKEMMLKYSIECIPVVSSDKKILSAIWWHDIFENKAISKKKIKLPIVLMAGGEGTRLSPFTSVLPKPLMLIGDKPISEIIMERFSQYGCRLFYMSVNYKSNIIKAYFDDFNHPYKIHFINEKKPLGTAGSLSLLKNNIKTTFFVTNCDIIIEADYSDILSFHKQNGNHITLVGSMKHYTIPYGICRTGRAGILNAIEEKPEYDYLVNTGMYVLEPEIMKFVPKGKLFHMTDLMRICMKSGKKVAVYPISEKSWMDMGQFEELKEMLKKVGA